MNDIGAWMKEHDPLIEEGAIPLDEVDRLRRSLLLSVAAHQQPRAWSPSFLVIATTILLTLSAGIAIGRYLPPAAENSSAGARPAETIEHGSAPTGVRQLQFATSGGTRIIWVFNSNLSL